MPFRLVSVSILAPIQHFDWQNRRVKKIILIAILYNFQYLFKYGLSVETKLRRSVDILISVVVPIPFCSSRYCYS